MSLISLRLTCGLTASALPPAFKTLCAASVCHSELGLRFWKDADPNIRILKEAKEEYARLQ
jgi:hypothetical protein